MGACRSRPSSRDRTQSQRCHVSGELRGVPEPGRAARGSACRDRRAEALDPLSPFIAANVILRLNALGRYEEALGQAHKALALDSNLWLTHQWMGGAYGDSAKSRKRLPRGESTRASGWIRSVGDAETRGGLLEHRAPSGCREDDRPPGGPCEDGLRRTGRARASVRVSRQDGSRAAGTGACLSDRRRRPLRMRNPGRFSWQTAAV